MDTIDRLQRWISSCNQQASLGHLVTPARRLSTTLQKRFHEFWPALHPVPADRFAAVAAAALMMVVECTLHPRNWALPFSVRAFYLRARWYSLRDDEFDGLYGMAWVVDLSHRRQDVAEEEVSTLLFGTTIERILYGKNDASGAPGCAVDMGKTVVHMARQMARGDTQLFFVSDATDEEHAVEAKRLNDWIFATSR